MKTKKKHKKYPKCSHYRNKRHRFGNLSFQEVCLYREERYPDDICKCGFSRKEWKER